MFVNIEVIFVRSVFSVHVEMRDFIIGFWVFYSILICFVVLCISLDVFV